METNYNLFYALRHAEARMVRSLEAVKASPCPLNLSNLEEAVDRFRALAHSARTEAEANRQGRA